MDEAKDIQIKEKNSQTNPQCQFFVVRKKRLCRMTVRPGRNYCGEHEPQPRKESGRDDTRVPCPYDPKHTCYASKMLKHLAICNARQQQAPDYIVQNINAPLNPNNPPRKLLKQIPQHKIMALIEKVNILYDKYVKDEITSIAENPIHAAVLEDFQEEGRTESSLRHLKQASSLLHIMEAEKLVQDNTCYVELGAGKGHLSYYAYRAWCGDNSSRVLLVDRASLRHKRDNKLREARTVNRLTEGNPQSNASNVNTSNTENGSATDISSSRSNGMDHHSEPSSTADNVVDGVGNNNADSFRAICKTDQSNTEIDALENNTRDHDVDSTSATEMSISESGSSSRCCRIRADLAHLALEKVPEVAQCAAVVGFAKHLCGAATDYALRCITATGVVAKVRGVVLATCCHHRCEAATYVGTDYLQEMGLDAEDVNIMLGIVSWATCGDGRGRERRQRDALAHSADTTDTHVQADEEEGVRIKRAKVSEEGAAGAGEALGGAECAGGRAGRAAAGRRAKALLEAGRARFLRRAGLRVRLCRYVPATTSLENLCIVACNI